MSSLTTKTSKRGLMRSRSATLTRSGNLQTKSSFLSLADSNGESGGKGKGAIQSKILLQRGQLDAATLSSFSGLSLTSSFGSKGSLLTNGEWVTNTNRADVENAIRSRRLSHSTPIESIGHSLVDYMCDNRGTYRRQLRAMPASQRSKSSSSFVNSDAHVFPQLQNNVPLSSEFTLHTGRRQFFRSRSVPNTLSNISTPALPVGIKEARGRSLVPQPYSIIPCFMHPPTNIANHAVVPSGRRICRAVPIQKTNVDQSVQSTGGTPSLACYSSTSNPFSIHMAPAGIAGKGTSTKRCFPVENYTSERLLPEGYTASLFRRPAVPQGLHCTRPILSQESDKSDLISGPYSAARNFNGVLPPPTSNTTHNERNWVPRPRHQGVRTYSHSAHRSSLNIFS